MKVWLQSVCDICEKVIMLISHLSNTTGRHPRDCLYFLFLTFYPISDSVIGTFTCPRLCQVVGKYPCTKTSVDKHIPHQSNPTIS